MVSSGNLSLIHISLPRKITDSIKKGFGFVPEDRRNQGFTPLLSIERNVALTNYDTLAKGGFVKQGKEKKLGIDMVETVSYTHLNVCHADAGRFILQTKAYDASGGAGKLY